MRSFTALDWTRVRVLLAPPPLSWCLACSSGVTQRGLEGMTVPSCFTRHRFCTTRHCDVHHRTSPTTMPAHAMLTHLATDVRAGRSLWKTCAASRWSASQFTGGAASRTAPAATASLPVRGSLGCAVSGSWAGRPPALWRMRSARDMASSSSVGGKTSFLGDSFLRQPMAPTVPAFSVAVVGAASLRRHVHATPSPRGLFSSFGNAYQKVKLDKEVALASESFALTLKSLVDLGRPMDADAYLAIVREGKAAAGLDGWRASLPWVASSAAVAEVAEVEEIIAAMTPAERRQVRLLGGAAARRVAEAAGVETAKVEELVKNVQSMRVLQKWLCKRKASGRALPTSRKELLVMMAAPGSGASMHMHAQRGT